LPQSKEGENNSNRDSCCNVIRDKRVMVEHGGVRTFVGGCFTCSYALWKTKMIYRLKNGTITKVSLFIEKLIPIKFGEKIRRRMRMGGSSLKLCH
jgi:hypothetical protein